MYDTGVLHDAGSPSSRSRPAACASWAARSSWPVVGLGASAGLSLTSLMSRSSSGVRSACVARVPTGTHSHLDEVGGKAHHVSVLCRLWKSSRALPAGPASAPAPAGRSTWPAAPSSRGSVSLWPCSAGPTVPRDAPHALGHQREVDFRDLEGVCRLGGMSRTGGGRREVAVSADLRGRRAFPPQHSVVSGPWVQHHGAGTRYIFRVP